MGRLLDTLRAGSASYVVEETGIGVVLVSQSDDNSQFSELVRDLLNRDTEEFVILPVSDGHRGYERVILLPF